MKHFSLILYVVLVHALVVVPRAAAWNDAGHMQIAINAYALLSEDAQRAYIKLLEQHPRFKKDFSELRQAFLNRERKGSQAKEKSLLAGPNAWIFAFAATWPDLARHFGHEKKSGLRERLTKKYHHGTWHYVNFPLYLDARDKDVLSIPQPVSVINAKTKLWSMNIMQALKYSEIKINDSKLAAADRAVYLCWWLHLMGDLHQPLHNVALFSQEHFAKGDRGGNLVRIGKKSNLHRVWDGSLAKEVEKIVYWPVRYMPTIDEKLLLSGESYFARWSRQNALLAKKHVYTGYVRNGIRKQARQPTPSKEQYRSYAKLSDSQGKLAVARIVALLERYNSERSFSSD